MNSFGMPVPLLASGGACEPSRECGHPRNRLCQVFSMTCGNGWHREKRSGTLAKSAVSAPAGMKKDLDTTLSIYVDLSVYTLSSENKEAFMKSLRTLSSAGFLVLALLAACFSTGVASGQDSKGRSSSWDNLKSLTPGQEIRVVMNNVKSYQGEFESLSDDGITLRQAAGEQTLARKDVLRVSRKKGKTTSGETR